MYLFQYISFQFLLVTEVSLIFNTLLSDDDAVAKNLGRCLRFGFLNNPGLVVAVLECVYSEKVRAINCCFEWVHGGLNVYIAEF